MPSAVTMIPRLIAASLTFALGFAIACESESDCQLGTEGCQCIDGACLQGLVCLSQYCVDPNWNPDGGASEGGMADAGSNDGDDGDDGSGPSPDNVAACKAFVDEISCGDFDFSSMVDCDVYAGTVCDISDYFDCLRDATGCVEGFPETSGWVDCVSLAECT